MKPYPIDVAKLSTYSKHVALLVSLQQLHIQMQRKFIRQATVDLTKDLHKKFATWVKVQYPTGISSAQWAELMEEDARVDYAAVGHDTQRMPEVEHEETVLQAGSLERVGEQCMHASETSCIHDLKSTIS